MKTSVSLLITFLIPTLLSAQALHQWNGEGLLEEEPFAFKLVVLQNEQFIALIRTQEAPLAIEGTWESEDEHTLILTMTTENIAGEDIPIREGKLYLIDDTNAVIVAAGFGIELAKITSSE